MKRIIHFCFAMMLVIPASLIARTSIIIPTKKSDTSSSVYASAKSIVLRGNLASFNAAYVKNYFELNWNTVAGNFDHFEIERSLDGEKYEKIGLVQNAATATTDGQYIFRDHFRTSTALNNDFFYRLKQFEANGNIVYSKVLIARIYNTKSLASLSITPDPLANDILVNVQLNENSYVVMKVLDASGNQILKEGKKAVFGLNSYSLEGTHNLTPGIYTLEVTVNSKERMTMKLSKG